MATGTFTYNALHTKYEDINKNCKSFKLEKSNAVFFLNRIFPLVGLVCFARYCGKMYSRHLFSYVGLVILAHRTQVLS